MKLLPLFEKEETQMAKTREQIIYRVGFHLYKPKNKYQLYEFLSKKKAYSFYESVKEHPNVMNGFFWSDVLDDSARYDGKIMPKRDKAIAGFGYD